MYLVGVGMFSLGAGKAQTNAVAAKKPFFLDAEYLLVALLFLIVLFNAKAFAAIQAPQSVVVAGQTSILVDISNDSSKELPLKVNFYSPYSAQITAPKSLAPKSTATVRIVLDPQAKTESEITATVEAAVGEKIEQKTIVLQIKPTTASLAGFFALSITPDELGKFSLLEWTAFWVLIAIAAVLLFGFISKLGRRF